MRQLVDVDPRTEKIHINFWVPVVGEFVGKTLQFSVVFIEMDVDSLPNFGKRTLGQLVCDPLEISKKWFERIIEPIFC